MMKHSIQLICLVFLLCCSSPHLSAEVFSLWPFSGGSNDVDDALRPAKLWSEKVSVNGRTLEMGVSLIQNPLDICYRNLRKLYPQASFAANSNSLLAEIKLKNGMRRRLYLLSLEGVYPTIEFSMDLPSGPLLPSDWPADFPLPPGAKPITTMEFPKRNAVYGAFSSDFQISQALPDVVSALKAAGWNSVTAEHKDPFNGTGEIFIRKDPASMMIIGFTPRKNGGCIGTIYKRLNK